MVSLRPIIFVLHALLYFAFPSLLLLPSTVVPFWVFFWLLCIGNCAVTTRTMVHFAQASDLSCLSLTPTTGWPQCPQLLWFFPDQSHKMLSQSPVIGSLQREEHLGMRSKKSKVNWVMESMGGQGLKAGGGLLVRGRASPLDRYLRITLGLYSTVRDCRAVMSRSCCGTA